ncbi:MAG TPA: fatty acid desaturase [Acidobacteriaceae bacterium]|jgi:stearoyl-CoA desaturase (delta-9 desaturase)|nr:fatty acid desaturase [Acidobacteriaceae bacterium]
MSPEMLVEAAEIPAVDSAHPTATAIPQPHAEPRQRVMPKLGRKAQGGRISKITMFFMVLFHIGAVAALFTFSWKALACFAVLWFMAYNLGIGMCYHRLLTHRGYRVPKWLEYFMTVCATLALEGGPIFWVGLHRVHHQLSDQEGDPHTPNDGGWWAHVGWIISGESLHAETEALGRYVPDLKRDRFYVWLSKYHWVPMVVAGLICLAVAGIPGLLWGIFLRTTLGLHSTWLVNSATHMWGSRRFETRDESRNSWWVAVLTGGEGWHNNHHAHPVSARHGLKWYEMDVNYYGIWLLNKVGLAREVKLAQYDPGNPRPAGVA